MGKVDFIELFKLKQEEMGITDGELSNRTGISEYIIYDLKKYRIYLTKVAYLCISVVLNLAILSDEEINNLISSNELKVGSPNTNLKIAAQVANPEYVTRLEKEILALQKLKDRMESTQELVRLLRQENMELKDKIIEVEKDKKDEVKEIYQNVTRELNFKMRKAIATEIEKEYDSKIEELEEKVKKRDIEINKYEVLYYNFYMDIFNKTGVKPEGYSIPKLATSSELQSIREKSI